MQANSLIFGDIDYNQVLSRTQWFIQQTKLNSFSKVYDPHYQKITSADHPVSGLI